jgi:hypothetical protein
VAPDGTLRDCAVEGSATQAEEAAMRTLAEELKAADRTVDGTLVRGARVFLVFDWSWLAERTEHLRR